MIQNNLAFTLDVLRLATIYSVAPSTPSVNADPTPVTFTLANKKVLKPVPVHTISLSTTPVKIGSPTSSYSKGFQTDSGSSEENSSDRSS